MDNLPPHMLYDPMKIIGFVIHLARATSRRSVAERLCADCGVPCEIADAVDGSALTAAELTAVYSPGLIAPRYPFALRAGEIGCFLSHRQIWQRLLDSDAEAALILEDDLAMSPDFVDALALAQRNLPMFGYIQFQTRPLVGAALDELKVCCLYQPDVTPLRTSGQLISRDTAERLLALTTHFDRPIDTFLQMHWHTGLRLGAIAPSGLSDRTAEVGGSTISQRRPLIEKLTREWQRGRYRRTVRRLSQEAAPT